MENKLPSFYGNWVWIGSIFSVTHRLPPGYRRPLIKLYLRQRK